MIPLLLALALAQFGGAPESLKARPHPLLVDDSGTLCHAFWDASGVRDTKACRWSTVGRPPISVPRIGLIGAGRNVGPFSDMDYVHIVGSPAGTDPLDTTGDFTCRVIFTANNLPSSWTLVEDGVAGSSGEGWEVDLSAQALGAVFNTFASSSASKTVTASNAFLLHVPTIISFGRTGTSQKIKLNGGSTATATGAKQVSGTHTEARIGRADGLYSPLDGTIHEVQCTSTAWDETAESAIQARFLNSLKSGVDDWTGAGSPLVDCRNNNAAQGDWMCTGADMTHSAVQPLSYASTYCGSGLRSVVDTGAVFDGTDNAFYAVPPEQVAAQTGDFSVALVLQATQSALAEAPVFGRAHNAGGDQWEIVQTLGNWRLHVYTASANAYLTLGAVTVGTPQALVVSYTDATGHVDANLGGTAVSGTINHPINPVTPYLVMGWDTATYWPGKVVRATLWQSAFTVAQQAAMVNTARTELGCTQKWVTCLGDSITYGQSTTVPYPTLLRRLLGSSWEVNQNGYPGDTAAQAATRWDTGIRGTHTHLALMVGINSIRAGTSGADTWTTVKAIVDEAYADGTTVILMTVTPFKNASGWDASKQTELEALNTSIRAYTSRATIVDTYALLGDTDPKALKAAYDSGDGLHPNDAGAAVIANAVKAALSP